MKKFFLFTLLSFLLSNAFAQQQPAKSKKQVTVDSIMQQVNQSLAKLNIDLRRLDSMHITIPLQKIEKQIIIIDGDTDINEIDNDNDSIEVNINNWKVNIGDDGDSTNSGVEVMKEEEKTVEINDDKQKELKNIKTIWLGLDLGLNNYLNSSGALAAPKGYAGLELNAGKSIQVNIHIVHQQINLIKHVLNLDYGLYFQINNYNFRSNTETLTPHVDSVAFAQTDKPLRKSKLTDTYLTIPIAFDIETNPHKKMKSFHIMAGGFGAVLIGSHTKQVDSNGDKIKIHDNFNLNTLQYGLMGRIGYGPVNLYVNYALSSLFTNGVQPDLAPVSAGIGLWF